MKNPKSSFFGTLIIIVIIVIAITWIVTQNNTEYSVLHDSTGTVSDRTEAYIVKRNDILYAEVGARIIVISGSTGESDKSAYAEALVEDIGLSTTDKEKTFLLFIDVTKREYGYFAGSDISRAFLTETVDGILYSKLRPFVNENEIGSGIDSAFKAILSVVEDYYGKDIVGVDYDSYFKNSEIKPLSQTGSGGGVVLPVKAVLSVVLKIAVGAAVLILLLVIIIFVAARASNKDDMNRKKQNSNSKKDSGGSGS